MGGCPLLDRILRTRTHVRVLRALVLHDGRSNLSARDIGRRAHVAHTSAIRALRELEATGIVEARRVREHALYDLRPDHVLAPALAALFDDELHHDQSLIAFIRGRARDQGRVVRIDLRRSEEGHAYVRMNGRGLEGGLAWMWVERLREEVLVRFGEDVDVLIEERQPSSLEGLFD